MILENNDIDEEMIGEVPSDSLDKVSLDFLGHVTKENS